MTPLESGIAANAGTPDDGCPKDHADRAQRTRPKVNLPIAHSLQLGGAANLGIEPVVSTMARVVKTVKSQGRAASP
jgi:hypothetical protein